MGGNISKNNTRINLIIPKTIKKKVEECAKAYNRSAGSTCVNIITNPMTKGHLRGTDDLSEIADMKKEGQARMNLVIPIPDKEQLQAEAEDQGRSLNNYIISLLYVAFYG